MTIYKVIIDQIKEILELSNDHSHLGKLKWLSKYRNYKNSVEEKEDTSPKDKVVDVIDGQLVVDEIHPSSTPVGSTTIRRLKKNKKKNWFFSRRRKSRNA